MTVEWDYSALADAYLKRPNYSGDAVDSLLALCGVSTGARVCDVGAGVAHLTIMLAERGLQVTAVEPNAAMRSHGIGRTRHLPCVEWVEGTGESTGQPADHFELVTFGSSFNVTDRPRALAETARILKQHGWFACLWNHRDLEDPLQRRIEEIIASHVLDYSYGTRREDQTGVIDASGLFGEVTRIDAEVVHRQTVADVVEAWRSHATLQRQAGPQFGAVVAKIQSLLDGIGVASISVPYTTRIWAARVHK